jgi:hypothetical protein
MKIFQVGETYYDRSMCDHNCIYTADVIKRMNKSVLVIIRDRYDKPVIRRIIVRDGVEGFYPFGRYSMASYISANKIYDPKTVKPDWEK